MKFLKNSAAAEVTRRGLLLAILSAGVSTTVAAGQMPVVKPVSSETTLPPAFDYEAPANSLTVFRIQQ
jgi:hypothetical protein